MDLATLLHAITGGNIGSVALLAQIIKERPNDWPDLFESVLALGLTENRSYVSCKVACRGDFAQFVERLARRDETLWSPELEALR